MSSCADDTGAQLYGIANLIHPSVASAARYAPAMCTLAASNVPTRVMLLSDLKELLEKLVRKKEIKKKHKHRIMEALKRSFT